MMYTPQEFLAGGHDMSKVSNPRLYAAHWVLNSASDYKVSLLLSIFFICFFFASWSLFFFLSVSIRIVQRTSRPLYSDLEWWMHGYSFLLTILSIFALPWLTFAFCINDPFSTRHRMKMTTNIDSPAPGLGGPGFFFPKCSHFSIVESLAIVLICSFPLDTTTDTFGAAPSFSWSWH
jgi:hypothetical protein